MRNDEAKLKRYGFLEAGSWELSDGAEGTIRHKLHALRDSRVLYAFVHDSEVAYIGICDGPSTTLKQRMNNYQSPGKTLQNDSTNRKVAGFIRDCLAQGDRVRIFALNPPSDPHFTYFGAPIDLVKGLENAMIQDFDPDLNANAPSQIAKRQEAQRQTNKLLQLADKEDYEGLLTEGLSETEAEELIGYTRAHKRNSQQV